MKVNEDPAFEALLELLKTNRGFDFTGYKRSSLARRIGKRMAEVGISDFAAYGDYLQVHDDEFMHLFNTILINLTSFFRDPDSWAYLRDEVVPLVAGRAPGDGTIRVWSVGCSSGQEAYSLAMLFAEELGEDAFRRSVKIYATDVDEEALALARHATYSAKDVESVPAEMRSRYFERSGASYTFRADLRRAVIFGQNDVTRHAPISRLDLLVCRNTLMYFTPETQARVLGHFHFALKESGFLFLGRAEMMLTHAKLFAPVSMHHRVFGRLPKPSARERMVVLAQAGDTQAMAALSEHDRLRDLALELASDATIVVDRNGLLTLANQTARQMFGLDAKDIGRLFQDLELSYRPVELRSLMERAVSEARTIVVNEVARPIGKDITIFLEVRVTPLTDDEGQQVAVSVTFRDVSRLRALQEELEKTSHERETALEELHSSNEELETTNEELQSTIEELQTTNEELQSTNEEMETMNEELQSSNEEQLAVNDELRARTGELARLNVFLDSVVASIDRAIVVVDRNLTVLHWNAHAAELWGLRPEEVRGCSLLALDIGLPVERLAEPLRSFLEGDEVHELVLPALNRRGKRISVRVTCGIRVGVEGQRQGAVLLMEAQPSEP